MIRYTIDMPEYLDKAYENLSESTDIPVEQLMENALMNYLQTVFIVNFKSTKASD